MVSCRLRHLVCLGARSFGLISRDLSVLSDSKTTPLMYGSTAVDLNSAVFLSSAGFLVSVTFCNKGEGCRCRRELWIDVSSPGLFLMAW